MEAATNDVDLRARLVLEFWLGNVWFRLIPPDSISCSFYHLIAC